jgi:DNA-binding LytR/AlgR family response regulator
MRILVVDDEELARGRLVRLLGDVTDVRVVGEAADGVSALAQIEALEPDLVLLDVDMPGMDGLSLAERPNMPPIVFTTAHSKFAIDAFEADAYDFLVKPVARERLVRAIEKVRARKAPPTSNPAMGARPAWQLTIVDGAATRLVDARTITRFYALDKYVAAQVEGKELLLRETLDELGERLGELGFMRVHRAELVRITAVKALVAAASGTVARLSDGQEARVSRRSAQALRSALGIE